MIGLPLTHETNSVQSSPAREKGRIAIIGSGYTGRAIAQFWQEQGHVVTVTTTRPERVPELEPIASQVVVLHGSDSSAVRSVIEGRDTVLLSVAPIGNQQMSVQVYADTYLPTAKNLVVAVEETPSVGQIVYLSSCSVYGDRNGAWVDETAALDTDSERNQVLLETERMLLGAAHAHLRVCLFRLGGIYGPGRELTKRIAKIAGKTIPGSGTSFSGWIHLDDVVAAVDFARRQGLNGIYNLTNDFSCSSGELCDRICAQQEIPKVEWDGSQSAFRTLNARIDNGKLKAAGYQLIHPQTID
jgi:nucleoside-diphosphate-sugar epimerase